jgi:hypothetical protein
MDCGRAVYVTEFYINPKRVKDRMGEFIELYNADDVAVRLNGWRLTDLAGDSHIISPPDTLTIAPGQFLVLGLNADRESNGGIPVDYQYAGFNLSNDADRVRLEDPCGDPVFDVSYPLPRNWPKHRAGHSIELFTNPASGKRPQWKRSRHRLKSGDYATPGFATWRRVRSPAPKAAQVGPAGDKPISTTRTTHRRDD